VKRIAVIGLGYVGAVISACMADAGNEVAVVEIDPAKVAQLNAGQSPILEPGLAELIAANVAAGRLYATGDAGAAVRASEASIICVGTPSTSYGDVALSDLDRVVEQLGAALRSAISWHLVLLASTVPPGTTGLRVIPQLENISEKVCGEHFGVAFSPEFLREGTAVCDYVYANRTVIGASDQRSFDCAAALLAPYATSILPASLPVAEMVKLTDNCWHALKVAFSNEMGRICTSLGLDSHAVMEIFKSDDRLNISAAYLTPGYAFGGSCLPKDLRTLVYRARQAGVATPVIDAILPSNREQVDEAVRAIASYRVRRVSILGLAFKAGTDDLRESAMLELAERLLGKGYGVTIHDDYVNLDRLIGANRSYIFDRHPHIAALLCDTLEVAVKDAELIVVGQANAAYSEICDLVPDRPVLDLCGVAKGARGSTPNYRGLAW
jgi:GDP-mannose 6-dehydrogenase